MKTWIILAVWLGVSAILYLIIRWTIKESKRINEEMGKDMERERRLKIKKYGFAG